MAVLTSLPTPPGTSHRDKEITSFPGSRVSWTQQNQYHILTSPKGHVPFPPTASRQCPTKSILKRSTSNLLTVSEHGQREPTPEPEDPLVNLSYLTRPVSQILASETSFTDLIDAYAVLAARIRSAVAGTTDADASWPLFQPLRKNTQSFTDAVCRDLGKALVEPNEEFPFAREEEEELPSLLPSPKKSPKKKKRGMSAGQAKYARDLCTTSHAVMRLLGSVFTLPAVYRIFTDTQLGEMLTAVLSIPMADVLPTPNARKTCALSIWLLQVQRLPEEVLVPAKDRIAFALRRGMEGELGKEGKKGSACDGLKAIHDLSAYQPSTFVPAFTELLPSILANLLAPTLLLRTQACHALGGFTLACVSIPQSSLHVRISKAVAAFLTTTQRSSSPRKTPTKPSLDPIIVRTLRTTLNALEPQHAAQGPVWALSVIASFIVLLGPAVYLDVRLTRIISALLQLAVRNKKSSVRGLACVTWRCVAWSYFRPPPSTASNNEDNIQDVNDKDVELLRENYWKLLKSITDMGAGVSTVAALLGDDSEDEDRLRKTLTLIKAMIKKGGQTCGDGMEIARILVSFENTGENWTMNKLLPHSLFSSNPGLLTAEYKTLASAVRPILEECPQTSDIRSLTRDELSCSWVFDDLIHIWRSGLGCLELPEDSGTPGDVLSIWEGLLKANVAVLQDDNDDHGTIDFASKAAAILVDILRDPKLDLSAKFGPPPSQQASSPISGAKITPGRTSIPSRSNAALKLVVTRDLWTVIRTTFPNNVLHSAGARLLACLIEDEADLVWETDSPDDARKQWAYLCAEVLVVCEVDDLREFWAKRSCAVALMSYEPGVQSLVWGCFVEKWTEDAEGSWEGAALLLGVPFGKSNAWDMANDEFDTWDNFLQHAVNKALDYGIDASNVLDRVAEIVSENPCPAYASSTRVADLLLTHLDMADARQLPSYIFDFVNDTLQSTYPPEPRNKVTSIWMIRSLIRVVDACPAELRLNLLETLQEGISLWISDEFHVFTEDEYTGDLLPLYQTSLLSMQELPRSVYMLDTLSALIESVFYGRGDKPSIAYESFEEFWQSTFASHEEPEGGWPKRIQACEVTIEVSETVPQVEESESGSSSDSLDSDNHQYPSSQTTPELESPFVSDQNDLPSSDHFTNVSPFVGRLGPALFSPFETLESDSPLFPSIFFPTTPTQRQNRAETPPRPQKPSTTPESFHSLLLRSPASTLPLPSAPPSTPRRLSAKLEKTPCSASPGKRRMLEDKENMSPVRSVMQRIANSSPSKDTLSVLGQRQLPDDPLDDITKKGRRACGTFIRSSIEFPHVDGDSDFEDEQVVASLLSPSRSSVSNLCSTPVVNVCKKRKRVLMDAVVLPPLEEVRLRWQMQRRASIEHSSVMTTPSKGMRRTRSLPLFSDTETDESDGSCQKRMRLWDDSDSTTLEEQLSSSPLRALEDVQMAGSDDSIMLTGPTREPSKGSDDDLHALEVPQHLVSPAPRRMAHDLSSDPPSSPSRELLARRKHRIFSLSEKPSLSV
ncbi:uncharacterized protein BJ212DRAFT_1331086 [Suillus subaureus]|uniref:Telomere-associated protein Rif1 N-terminal domain-containing protein n=1 Tax=Suillus subaureus TaxID=48587 RepID=A0A9P7EIN0_9AGAM|nr:uncharacterized protein BJ212DRAFT_1331086 [Suillus subaureus]KAG1822871.1 hypothetical protein BJ212DRAFT_1331086 [Suillus subaureus]